MNKGGQFVLLVETSNDARRIGEVVPHQGLVAISVENDRALAVHGFQTVSIKLRLLLPYLWVNGSLLRLHHCRRLPVIAPQDIVCVTDTLLIGHTGNFVLAVVRLIQWPTCPLQGEVDDEPSGFFLVPVVGLGDGLVLRLDYRESFAQRF